MPKKKYLQLYLKVKSRGRFDEPGEFSKGRIQVIFDSLGVVCVSHSRI